MKTPEDDFILAAKVAIFKATHPEKFDYVAKVCAGRYTLEDRGKAVTKLPGLWFVANSLYVSPEQVRIALSHIEENRRLNYQIIKTILEAAQQKDLTDDKT